MKGNKFQKSTEDSRVDNLDTADRIHRMEEEAYMVVEDMGDSWLHPWAFDNAQLADQHTERRYQAANMG